MRGFFKRIGQGIKKGVQKFGKFMGKIGILGQIAMMFILPAVGGMMLRGLGAMTGLSGATAVTAGGAGATAAASSAAASAVAGGATTAAATAAAQSAALGTVGGFTAAAAGSGSVLAKGVAWTLKTAQKFANSPLLKPFKTVTDAVSGFVKHTVGYVGKKVGLGSIAPKSDFAKFFQDAPDAFFNAAADQNTSVFAEVGKSITNNWEAFTNDLEKGNIFMGGDTSLQKAWDAGVDLQKRPPLGESFRNAFNKNMAPSSDMVSSDVVSDYDDFASSGAVNNQASFDTDPTSIGTSDTVTAGTEPKKFSILEDPAKWLGDTVKNVTYKDPDSLIKSLAPDKLTKRFFNTATNQFLFGGGGEGGGPVYGSYSGVPSMLSREVEAASYQRAPVDGAYVQGMDAVNNATSNMSAYDLDMLNNQDRLFSYGSDTGTWGGYLQTSQNWMRQ